MNRSRLSRTLILAVFAIMLTSSVFGAPAVSEPGLSLTAFIDGVLGWIPGFGTEPHSVHEREMAAPGDNPTSIDPDPDAGPSTASSDDTMKSTDETGHQWDPNG